MKKIISIILIGLMTVGCGKTARLERLERERAEIAAEQARVDKLSKQKGVWKRISNNTWTYVIGTAAFVAVVVGVGALIYHRYKKAGIPPAEEDPNDQPAEVQQEEVHQVPQPEHFEENAQFLPSVNNDQELANIAEPPIDDNAAQVAEHPDPKQDLEATDDVEIPQQDVPQLEWDGDRNQWWDKDQQLWAAQQLEGHQQLTSEQQLRVDAYEAVLNAESRAMSSPYPYDSVERRVLNHQRDVAYGQCGRLHIL
jgi:hypothetical protein